MTTFTVSIPLPQARVPALQRIVGDLLSERVRQDEMRRDADAERELFFLLAVLGEEVGEANKDALNLRSALRCEQGWSGADVAALEAGLREELVQVAAVAMKIVEALDADRIYIHDAPVNEDEPRDGSAAQAAGGA